MTQKTRQIRAYYLHPFGLFDGLFDGDQGEIMGFRLATRVALQLGNGSHPDSKRRSK